MPEIDPTSPLAHLIQLCKEYKEIIDQMRSGRFETEEIHYLSGQRTVLHDQIIAEMEHLGIIIEDREEAMQRAFQIAQWLRLPE